MKHAILGLLTVLVMATPSWADDEKNAKIGLVEVLSVEMLPFIRPSIVLQDTALAAVFYEEPAGCWMERQDQRLHLATYVHLVGIGMELPYDWTLVTLGSVLATDYAMCKIKQRRQRKRGK